MFRVKISSVDGIVYTHDIRKIYLAKVIVGEYIHGLAYTRITKEFPDFKYKEDLIDKEAKMYSVDLRALSLDEPVNILSRDVVVGTLLVTKISEDTVTTEEEEPAFDESQYYLEISNLIKKRFLSRANLPIESDLETSLIRSKWTGDTYANLTIDVHKPDYIYGELVLDLVNGITSRVKSLININEVKPWD